MKKILLVALSIGIGLSGFAQYKAVKKNSNVVRTQVYGNYDLPIPGEKQNTYYGSTKSILDDPQVQMTNYDLSTNGAMGQARFYVWPDGTMAATSTMSHDQGGTWPGRGTGYNYSANGTTWGSLPSNRIESLRTGWPSIAPWGANGECVISHQSGTTPMVFLTRATKGTGTWTQTTVPNPSGETGMLWPRMITTGANHMTVHVIALTPPTGNGGAVWNGMDGALLYIRSTDGGATWGEWQQLNGMTTVDYKSFSGDDYGWANPVGETIAFFVSAAFMDSFIMKSTDGGSTWTKTVVYASDYNLVGVEGTCDLRFYTSDNTSAIALDKNGMAHVSFGLMADSISGSTSYNYWPYTQGLVYWNETMDAITPEMAHPDTLYNHGQLVGWVLDTMVFYTADALAGYRACGLTAMPTMSIDDDNNLFLVWSAPTTLMDPNNYMFRHLFTRVAEILPDGSAIWNDNIYDLNENFTYMFSECVWPSCATNSSADKFYLSFNQDDIAGSYVIFAQAPGYLGQSSITDNYLTIMAVDKPSIGVGVKNQTAPTTSFTVTPNYPNPFQGTTNIAVKNEKAGHLTLDVTNLAGQTVQSLDKGQISAGTHQIILDCTTLPAGIYFYTCKLNNESITNKMVVR